MEYLMDRITVDPGLCNGKPTIRGMRIPVQTVIGFLLAGTSEEEILHQYPDLELEDIKACKEFTFRLIDQSYVVKKIAS